MCRVRRHCGHGGMPCRARDRISAPCGRASLHGAPASRRVAQDDIPARPRRARPQCRVRCTCAWHALQAWPRDTVLPRGHRCPRQGAEARAPPPPTRPVLLDQACGARRGLPLPFTRQAPCAPGCARAAASGLRRVHACACGAGDAHAEEPLHGRGYPFARVRWCRVARPWCRGGAFRGARPSGLPPRCLMTGRPSEPCNGRGRRFASVQWLQRRGLAAWPVACGSMPCGQAYGPSSRSLMTGRSGTGPSMGGMQHASATAPPHAGLACVGGAVPALARPSAADAGVTGGVVLAGLGWSGACWRRRPSGRARAAGRRRRPPAARAGRRRSCTRRRRYRCRCAC